MPTLRLPGDSDQAFKSRAIQEEIQRSKAISVRAITRAGPLLRTNTLPSFLPKSLDQSVWVSLIAELRGPLKTKDLWKRDYIQCKIGKLLNSKQDLKIENKDLRQQIEEEKHRTNMATTELSEIKEKLATLETEVNKQRATGREVNAHIAMPQEDHKNDGDNPRVTSSTDLVQVPKRGWEKSAT